MLIGIHPHLIGIIFAFHLQPLFTHAFSSKGSNAALLSRLQTIQAELLLSIGRIPGTAMPPDWAASGAKLGFALEVEFTNELCEYEMTKERLLRGDVLMGNTLKSVEPLNEPSFVSSNGAEIVRVLPGAYGCQLQGIESGQYAFRFFLDFPEGARRNDVELPPERIYFLSSCWLADNEAAIGRARRRRDDLEQSIGQIKRDLEELEQGSSGLFQKAMAFRQSIDLVERRAKLASQLEELEQKYPLDSAKIMQGPNNIIFAKEGVVAVKRLRGTLGTREQYHWVGTFTFNDFFEDEEDD
mmetsp:Transcript_50580/g.107749  ORF Transcript_50580/g.107749 Transcript_50580/m.107749 type:complete len:298 (-) Transcript_50580:288-1181(-)|eukprot:CAMPEP_0172562290 /NCGR_PEP_ID=MMETSP1067-20121228/96381_1 /TAXON_ID=265564 ORGANISM="Thalassiosira punctigera, Strain Tpunct2005C2" /NCGR_SAMPLE_ID=MMETSP1067 /ASSEMBLY_ACC=CAM_ASM_000444 /LENGTH=297 /DNA_ID=CAMNT_0013352491 /DNA_START=123 /DNA_END=1016 /DNA_ORIENTATION=+